MDMDGFNLQGKFYCKELGLLKIDEETAKLSNGEFQNGL